MCLPNDSMRLQKVPHNALEHFIFAENWDNILKQGTVPLQILPRSLFWWTLPLKCPLHADPGYVTG